MHFEITYSTELSSRGGYSPLVFVNHKWQYTTVRNAKTYAGGLSRAKKIADAIAQEKVAFGNTVLVRETFINSARCLQ